VDVGMGVGLYAGLPRTCSHRKSACRPTKLNLGDPRAHSNCLGSDSVGAL